MVHSFPTRRSSDLRIEPLPHAPGRRAVYGATDEQPEKHFLGWADEVDPDELFESGRAWGITVLRERADQGR